MCQTTKSELPRVQLNDADRAVPDHEHGAGWPMQQWDSKAALLFASDASL
jgi:hypothetical protein